MSKYVFPAVFEPEDGLYNVSFPDLPDCYTCGDDLADAMFMAEDALSGYLSRMEEKGKPVCVPSALNAIPYSEGTTVSLVPADTAAWRRAHSERAVKKTLTIPSWLNAAAESHAINFSQVLQDALKERLGLNG